MNRIAKILVALTLAFTTATAAAVTAIEPVAAAMSNSDIQQNLNRFGAGLVVDGDIGPASKTAIRAFQRAVPGLDVDGVAGAETQAAFAWADPATVNISSTTSAGTSGGAGTGAGIATNPHAIPVDDLQRLLNRFGAELTVDGKSGPATTGAIRQLQSKLGLTVDGVAGQVTLETLGRVDPSDYWIGSTPDPSPEISTSDLQQLLNRFGAGLAVDGIPGPATTDAIRAFQSAVGLPVDGIAGEATLTTLGQADPNEISLGSGTGSDFDSIAEGEVGYRVGYLQRLLNLYFTEVQGNTSNVLRPDAHFGPSTRRVLELYQSLNGLVADGEAGAATVKSLEDNYKAISGRSPVAAATTRQRSFEDLVRENGLDEPFSSRVFDETAYDVDDLQAAGDGVEMVGYCAGISGSTIGLAGDGNTCAMTDGETAWDFATIAGGVDLLPLELDDLRKLRSPGAHFYTGPIYSNALDPVRQLADYSTCTSVELAVGLGASYTECFSDDYPDVWIRLPGLVIGAAGGGSAVKAWSTTPTEIPNDIRRPISMALACGIAMGSVTAPDVCGVKQDKLLLTEPYKLTFPLIDLLGIG